uniref:Uncharacterized protein n=1 Tax=Physcomitrium patens TaxID=3218 RepID=A0A2K1KU95_PHYPA|nr:hypothetical protein PHYPA_004351 [Physcomitrium patens]
MPSSKLPGWKLKDKCGNIAGDIILD